MLLLFLCSVDQAKYYRRAIFGYWMKQGDSSIADLEWELVNLENKALTDTDLLQKKK